MEQQILNQKILNELKKMRIDINILKQSLPEEEPILDVEKRLEMGLEDLRQGKIVNLN